MKAKKHKQREYIQELEIQAPREAVWKALSNATELTRWFSPTAEISNTEGGKIHWTWTDQIDWEQTIQVREEGTRLLSVYNSPVDDGQGGKIPLYIDFQLQGLGGKTTLRLIQSGFGEDASFDAEYDGISHGWPIELRSLQLYLEQHLGRARQLTWLSVDFNETPDSAWRKLIGPKGFNCSETINRVRSGDRFQIQTPSGDLFQGQTVYNGQRSFVGIAENWNNAFLRIQVENCGGSNQVWLWLASYGEAEEKIQSLKRSWETMLDQIFPQDQPLSTNLQNSQKVAN